ncbi:MAG: putative DNA binding domain-containing protein [Clostridia bacterium]|nr:putative DNA binding domain-containing protein [Clostridia bacterium]
MNIGRESELVEFKKTTSETKEGIISISSILNKHGKGELYFGVRDNGEVVGIEIGKDTERKLSRDISDGIKPAIWYEISTKHADDGKAFIEVQFRGDDAPYAAFGRYYQRFADEDRQISDAELERLFKQRRSDYSEWEKADSDEPISEVDEQLLKRIIENGNDSGRIRYEYSDAAAMLKKLGLCNNSADKLTNAGRVLFSSNKPVLLKTAVYATHTKDTFIKLNHFDGNIFECIDESISFVLSNIDWNIGISGEAKRAEEPEIPQKAIREMIVNAFAHGCYYSNTTFAIEIFSDKVMIYSPGRFPAGFVPEDFAYNAAEPIMLNPKIVNVLFKASVIESFGSGFERTFSACREAKVEYDYENTPTGFKFIFFRRHGQKNVHDMSKSEMAVYELLCDNDCLTIKELAKAISKSEKTVYRAIKALKEKGLIAREGNDANGYWKILE